MIDIGFPARGSVPLDHGYALFSALSRRSVRLHEPNAWAVHPLHGERAKDRLLLSEKSFVKIRMPVESIGDVLMLANCEYDIDGCQLRLGVPRIFQIASAARLRARIVTVKGYCDSEESLHGSVRRKLEYIAADHEQITIEIGRRHVMRIGAERERRRGNAGVIDRDIVIGFSVTLGSLSESASIAIQEVGIGGRRHLGAGVFVPAREEQ